MDAGAGLLWIGLLLAVGGMIPSAAHFVSGGPRFRRLTRVLLLLDFAVVTGAFLLMVVSFLPVDLSIAYVHAHTRTDYPWYYRLAGAWSGDTGSLLLWTWLQSLIVLLFSLGGPNDSPLRARLRVLT